MAKGGLHNKAESESKLVWKSIGSDNIQIWIQTSSHP